jgi:chorismate-pyruvate lyase
MAASSGPDLPTLLALFPPAASYLSAAVPVLGPQVPPPYHDLLVHEHHMTVTVEAHHGGPVDVVVLDRRLDGDSYARMILLALQGSGRIVQFGIARIRFAYCSQTVRDEIVSEKTPLGRILIQHNVLRRIEPTGFLKVTPGVDMMQWFRLEKPETTYGRLAVIYCDGQPAIEVLEIVAPERASPLS